MRIDTPYEIHYYQHGGILQYVLEATDWISYRALLRACGYEWRLCGRGSEFCTCP